MEWVIVIDESRHRRYILWAYSPIRDSQARSQRSHVHCPVFRIVIVFRVSRLACTAATHVASKSSMASWQRDRHDARASGAQLSSFRDIAHTHKHIETNRNTRTEQTDSKTWTTKWSATSYCNACKPSNCGFHTGKYITIIFIIILIKVKSNVQNEQTHQVMAGVFSNLEAVRGTNACRGSDQGCTALRQRWRSSPSFQLNNQPQQMQGPVCHMSNAVSTDNTANFRRHRSTTHHPPPTLPTSVSMDVFRVNLGHLVLPQFSHPSHSRRQPSAEVAHRNSFLSPNQQCHSTEARLTVTRVVFPVSESHCTTSC